VPPKTTAPFFSSVPLLPDKVTVNAGGQPFMTPGVKIPVGSKRTIDISLKAEAPTQGPWHVSAYDANYLVGGSPELELSLDQNSGMDGDVLHLTITVLKADTFWGVAGFVLFSDLAGQETIAMGAVGQD
jgi:hypothetical protein